MAPQMSVHATQESSLRTLIDKYQHIFPNGVPEHDIEQIVKSIIQYHEDIILAMPGNVYWLDKNCKAMGCSKDVLEMFGLTSVEQFKGLFFKDMERIGAWDSAATEAFERDSLEVIRTGRPILNTESPPIPHRDGRILHFLTSRVPLHDRLGNIIGVAGVSIDISELKRTQAALKVEKEKAEAASLAKSEFLANMSHDVKTPLSGIIGLSELLAHRLKDEENLAFAKTLYHSGQQLLNFFDNCLEVFKLESHDVTLSTECFDFTKLLTEIEELYKPAVTSKNLKFTVHYDKAVPSHIMTSRVGIYRVLLNLVGNAVKFTRKGFIAIRVTAETLEEQTQSPKLKIEVEDSGIGIPSDKQKVIFDRFSRLIPSYKGTYEGSGIGLYIVNKFVKVMNGRVNVNSIEGKGSCFTVSLPYTIPDSSQIQLAQHLTTAHKNQQRLQQLKAGSLTESIPNQIQSLTLSTNKQRQCAKILIVEDNLTAQLIQRSLLSSIHCDIEIAESGEKALELFEPKKYDLIFMDIGLPGLQGDTTAKLIRKMEKFTPHRTPIIALTAHSAENNDQTYLAAGMQAVLNKPLSREQAQQLIDLYARDETSESSMA
jgi:signal transduction histidine kinase/CheY-like chemotaxis protein